MALIDYNNGTATISVNGGQPPFSYLLKQGGAPATHDGANFVNPIVSSNQSVVFGDSSDLTGSYGMPSGAYTCEITDSIGCIVNTSEIVISQTEEATTLPTTLATAATTLATAATTLATAATTLATPATTLATAATTLATNATTLATAATTLAPTFNLSISSAGGALVDEGESIVFVLTTTNVVQGTTVPFTITGTATAGIDYTSDPNMFFTIDSNGLGTYTTVTIADESTEGVEYLTLTLAATDSAGNSTSGSGNVTGIMAAINDTSIDATTLATDATTVATNATTLATNATTLATNATTLAPTYTLTNNGPVNEGQDLTWTLSTENLPNGTEVEFTLGGDALVGIDYTDNSPHKFVINANTATWTVTTIEDQEEDDSYAEDVLLILAATDSLGNATGGIISNGQIYDTSVPILSYDTLGVQAQIDEGQAALFILNSSNIVDGTTVGYTITGINANDIVGSLTGTFTINNNTAQIAKAVVNDNLTEGTETMVMTLDATDSAGTSAGLTASVDINDTSIDATTLATTIAPLNRTFYYIHAGQSTTPYTSSLTGGGPFYINGGNGTSNDLNVAMQDMIANSGNQYYGLVESFDMPQGVNIAGNGNATTWSYPQTSAAEPYYIAVPDNADFPENLMAGGLLTNLANNQPTNAGSFASFTDANGNDYKLYQLAASSSAGSSNWAFV